MPLQNRVTPTGEIVVSPHRGSLMGNRGCLHNGQQEIITNSRRDAWLTCQLEFKGRKRPLMAPGQYTELFFLDEATALAAGHRPCFECRRERYNSFMLAWPRRAEVKPRAADVDAILKSERGRPAAIDMVALSKLPDGSMVRASHPQAIYLLLGGCAYLWSFAGYTEPMPLKSLGGPLTLITPGSTVQAFRNGYRPQIHASADSLRL